MNTVLSVTEMAKERLAHNKFGEKKKRDKIRI